MKSAESAVLGTTTKREDPIHSSGAPGGEATFCEANLAVIKYGYKC